MSSKKALKLSKVNDIFTANIDNFMLIYFYLFSSGKSWRSMTTLYQTPVEFQLQKSFRKAGEIVFKQVWFWVISLFKLLWQENNMCGINWNSCVFKTVDQTHAFPNFPIDHWLYHGQWLYLIWNAVHIV